MTGQPDFDSSYRSSRLAISGIMFVLALLFAFQTLLLYLDIGLPMTARVPGVMYTTGVTMYGISLVARQMYFAEVTLALVALLLTVGSVYMAVRAFVRPKQ